MAGSVWEPHHGGNEPPKNKQGRPWVSERSRYANPELSTFQKWFSAVKKDQARYQQKNAPQGFGATQQKPQGPQDADSFAFEAIKRAKNPQLNVKKNLVQHRYISNKKTQIANIKDQGSRNLKEGEIFTKNNPLVQEKAAQDKKLNESLPSGVESRAEQISNSLQNRVTSSDPKQRGWGNVAAQGGLVATQKVKQAALAQAATPEAVSQIAGKSIPANVAKEMQEIMKAAPTLSAQDAYRYALRSTENPEASGDLQGLGAKAYFEKIRNQQAKFGDIAQKLENLPERSLVTEAVGDVNVEISQEEVKRRLVGEFFNVDGTQKIPVTPANVLAVLEDRNKFSAREAAQIKQSDLQPWMSGYLKQSTKEETEQVALTEGKESTYKGKRTAELKEKKETIDPFMIPMLMSPVTETVNLVDAKTGLGGQGATYLEGLSVNKKDPSQLRRFRKLDAGKVKLAMLNPAYVLPDEIAGTKYRRYNDNESSEGMSKYVGVPTEDPLQQATLPQFDPNRRRGAAGNMTLGQALTQILLEGRTPIRDFAKGEVIEVQDGKKTRYFLPDQTAYEQGLIASDSNWKLQGPRQDQSYAVTSDDIGQVASSSTSTAIPWNKSGAVDPKAAMFPTFRMPTPFNSSKTTEKVFTSQGYVPTPRNRGLDELDDIELGVRGQQMRVRNLIDAYMPNRIDAQTPIPTGLELFPLYGSAEGGMRSYRVGNSFMYSNDAMRAVSDLIEQVTRLDPNIDGAYRPSINEPLARDDWRLKKIQGMALLDTTPKVLADKKLWPKEVLDVYDQMEYELRKRKAVNPNYKMPEAALDWRNSMLFDPGGVAGSQALKGKKLVDYPLGIWRSPNAKSLQDFLTTLPGGDSPLPKWQGQWGMIQKLLNASGGIIPDESNIQSRLPGVVMRDNFGSMGAEGRSYEDLAKALDIPLQGLSGQQKERLKVLARQFGPQALTSTSDPTPINPSLTAEAVGAISGNTNPQSGAVDPQMAVGGLKNMDPIAAYKFLTNKMRRR